MLRGVTLIAAVFLIGWVFVLMTTPDEVFLRERHWTNLDKNVHVVYLEDGTRCAVFQRLNRGGISCDWEGSSETDQ